MLANLLTDKEKTWTYRNVVLQKNTDKYHEPNMSNNEVLEKTETKRTLMHQKEIIEMRKEGLKNLILTG